MKKITFFRFVSSLMLLLTTTFFDLGNVYAQITTGDACISITNCPANQTKCADAVVGGQSGAYFTWDAPNVTQTCSGGNQNASFEMLFELNESLLKANCWKFNYIQRVGGSGGHIKLFSGNDGDNSHDSKISTPYLTIEDDTNASINVTYDGSNPYTVQLILVGDGTPSRPDIPLATQQVTSTTSTYSWATNFDVGTGSSTHLTGVYRLQFVFHYTGNKPSNANKGDTIIAVKAFLNDTGCSAGVDFTVTAPTPGFYTVGSHDLQYVATYFGSTGTKTKTCSFNVTVYDLPTAAITGTLNSCLSTTLTANTNAASPSYVWYKDNLIISGQTASTLIVTANGNYKVKIKNGITSCEQTSAASTVNVEDTTAPVITCPADFNTGTNTACTYVGAIGAATATDNCDTSVTITNNAPAAFPIGQTIVTWTATDHAGKFATCTQKVMITDTTKPVVPVLADVTGQCSATATAPVTTDNCSGTITGTTSDALTYSTQGTHTITWTFTDAVGNASTTTQNVVITDTTKPVVPVLADVTGQCSATATAPVTTDNCSGTITGTTSDALTYSTQGTHTITWTFTDAVGNASTTTQNVVITDTTKPVVPVLADVTGQCSATATAPVTTDNCSGTITGTTSDALTYSTQGTHTITWTFTDAVGNASTATQKVVITDTTKPVVPVLADVTGQCSATATAPVTTDNCSGTITGTTSDALTYATQGTHTITWTFTDAVGNASTATQNVVITDTTKPVVPVLADVTGQCSATATAPVTTDNC
ncbi:HYR domain-containing protein, partial [Flavobacterium sp. ZS1P14]|uniref:HYR-like domain-containing protein n=1 Tax=Flavobacterium sp. ZS1P14 TaxID=3401729 RepID=UPI003AB0A4CA